MVRETQLDVSRLIYPMFVSEKTRKPIEVPSMPEVYQYPVERIGEEAQRVRDLGIPAILLFGIPAEKDGEGTGAYHEEGVIQRALKAIKQAAPGLMVITDVCLCEYTDHGHCGVIEQGPSGYKILNDPSVDLLVKTAVSHADAGADIVAPSDMMDGRVGAIRAGLDAHDHWEVPIMSYASKFSSQFYNPFRDAAESAPEFGDRRSYQMDPANASEALREVAMDIEEGAELLIVKPGLAYLDILWRVKERFEMPTAVYNISGEYSMVKAAARSGWLDERGTVLEIMTGFRRAGADLIITYWAKDLVNWLKISAL
jgi:porphobilinogen synthase